jgi:hypothetical protein
MTDTNVTTTPAVLGLSQSDLVGKETVTPSLPSPPSDPNQMRQFLEKLKEIVEVREGRRGNRFDQNITWRDLFDNGMVDVNIDGRRIGARPVSPVFLSPGASEDFATPPAPENVTASAGFANVILSWTKPNFVSFAYAEIWRSDTNNIGVAQKVGTTTANVYADNVGFTNITKYYWVRYVNQNNVSGPYNASAGTAASTSKVGSSDLYDLIITADKLANSAVTNVKLADGSVVQSKIADAAVVGSKLANLAVEAAKLANSAVTAEKIANLAVGTAAIQDAAINSAKIASLAVGSAAIQDGAITNAKIGNAAIDNAKIASLDAVKITSGLISADRLDANTITAKVLSVDWAKITNVIVTNAQIGDIIQSSNYSAGSAGWRINKAGEIELNNATFRGTIDVKSASSGERMQVTNNVIKVFDSGGNIRVKIGNLAA